MRTAKEVDGVMTTLTQFERDKEIKKHYENLTKRRMLKEKLKLNIEELEK